jgi:hypothetical protein
MRRRALSTFRRLPAGEQQVEKALLAPAPALHLNIWCCHLTVCIIVSQLQASVHICRGVLLRVTLLASGFLIGMPPQMLPCVKQLFRQVGELELRLASSLMSGIDRLRTMQGLLDSLFGRSFGRQTLTSSPGLTSVRMRSHDPPAPSSLRCVAAQTLLPNSSALPHQQQEVPVSGIAMASIVTTRPCSCRVPRRMWH